MSRATKSRLSNDGVCMEEKPRFGESMEIQRSGKWTPEEESFANRLIIDFETGTLKDCEDGCTLRSYLARKLRCAPMRISKKFAGRCIGKLVFTRRKDGGCELQSSGVGSLEHLETLYKRSFQATTSLELESLSDIGRTEFYEPGSLSARSSGSLSMDEESSTSGETDSESRRTTSVGSAEESTDSRAFVFSFGNTKSTTDLQSLPSEIDDYSYGIDFETEFGYENFFLGEDRPVSIEADDEWRDVLSYFCGDEGHHSQQTSDFKRISGMKRTLSAASLLL